MTTTSISGSMNPYDIIAFIEQHASEQSAIIKNEMKAEQDSNSLQKDISDLKAELTQLTSQMGDMSTPSAKAACADAMKKVSDFMDAHPEARPGGSQDMSGLWCQLACWKDGNTPVDGTKTTPTADAATSATWLGGSSYDLVVDCTPPDAASAQAIVNEAANKLGSWSDNLTADDKIEDMTLTEDAQALKDLYEQGSNLNATFDQTSSAIVQNMKG